jgi:hypothetical protein
MYDIYLLTGCHSRPNLGDILTDVPKRIFEHSPGFIGLCLSRERATRVFDRLKSVGGRGYVIPSIYREPKISGERAQSIAELALQSYQESHEVNFAPVRLMSSDPMWWKFAAVSEELIQKGIVPGTLYICVDKIDGHVWQTQEFDEFFGD